MARELDTSWTALQTGVDRLLRLATAEIRIFDGDLTRLKVESAPRLAELKRLLQARRPDSLRIALQDTSPVQRNCPRLLQLLGPYARVMSMLKTSDRLGHLRDMMLLVDGRHGLILFDRDQPRFKLLIDEADEIEPYLRRFDDIWAEGGAPVDAIRLGL